MATSTSRSAWEVDGAATPSGYTKAFGPAHKGIQAGSATYSLAFTPTTSPTTPASALPGCNRYTNCRSFRRSDDPRHGHLVRWPESAQKDWEDEVQQPSKS